MVISHSYVSLPEGNHSSIKWPFNRVSTSWLPRPHLWLPSCRPWANLWSLAEHDGNIQYLQGSFFFGIFNQWRFQEPELEVPTLFFGLCKGYVREYHSPWFNHQKSRDLTCIHVNQQKKPGFHPDQQTWWF